MSASIDAFKRIVQDCDGNFDMIEFGACDGYHTEIMARHLIDLGVRFHYIALEPDPRLVPRLRNRVEPLGVHVIEGAVSDQRGTAPFWLSEGVSPQGQSYYGSSSIKPPTGASEAWPGLQFGEEINVVTYTFDQIGFLMGCGPPINFVWADIQGAEREMILGGEEMLGHTQWIHTECEGGGMYEGDLSEEQMMDLIGPDWEIAERPDDYNLLLRNVRLT